MRILICLRKVFFAAALVFVVLPTRAEFPEKYLSIIIPFSPGGTNDIVARLVAKELSPRLGKQVVPVNRPGAGGVIGWSVAAQASADGYTLLTTDTSFAMAAGLFKQLPFDPRKDFTAVTTVASTPFVMVVKSDHAAKSVAEFVALAKSRPGKLNYGSGGNGTNSHLAAEVFKLHNAVQISHIPYKGASAALLDLVTGQIDVLFTALPTAMPNIKSGKLKALMVTSAGRLPLLPEVPSAKELNQDAMLMDFWAGVAVRTGTPPAIVQQLNQAIVEAMSRPEGKQALAKQGLFTVLDTSEQAARKMNSEIDRWAAVVKAAKISVEQ
jgi:tripartite-type tricarboxylate transporter receptor subunit TctC